MLNPANVEMTISPGDSKAQSKDALAKSFSIILTDEKGATVLKQNSDVAGKLVFNTKSLPNGVYNLEIIEKDRTIREKILIQH